MFKKSVLQRYQVLSVLILLLILVSNTGNAMTTLFSCDQEVLPAFKHELQLETIPFHLDTDGTHYYLRTPSILGVPEQVRTIPSSATINVFPGGQGITIAYSKFNFFTRKVQTIDIQIGVLRSRVVVEFNGFEFLNDSNKVALEKLLSDRGEVLTAQDIEMAKKSRFVCRDSGHKDFPRLLPIISLPHLNPIQPILPIFRH